MISKKNLQLLILVQTSVGLNCEMDDGEHDVCHARGVGGVSLAPAVMSHTIALRWHPSASAPLSHGPDTQSAVIGREQTKAVCTGHGERGPADRGGPVSHKHWPG